VVEVELQNLDSCLRNGRYYGGDAGKKYGIIIDGENWIVKFPQQSESKERSSRYSNSPLGEYIGSHVFHAFGIPVHDTMLGIRENKIVAACKDFEENHNKLIEFKSIKNAYLPSDGREGAQGSGNGTVLSDVLDVIENETTLSRVAGIRERFWDMFVIDYFIGNSDRNNTNWGILRSQRDDNIALAPVYDNGRSFSESALLSILTIDDLLNPETIKSYQCNYLTDSGDYIKPYTLFQSHTYPECDEALLRFARGYKPVLIKNIVDTIPNDAFGFSVISDKQREIIVRMSNARYTHCIQPALEALIGNDRHK
jgi:hypothetical protein